MFPLETVCNHLIARLASNMDKPHVLVVEDSKSVARNLRDSILQELGFDVTVAYSHKAAVDLVAADGSRFFVAILDLSLPDALDGEIVDFMIDRKIPAIVYTSLENPALRTALLSKNIIDYVYKNNQGVKSLTAMIKRLYINRDVHVLVVDDSKLQRFAIKSMLKTYMFQVAAVRTPDEALAVLHINPNISLVITDFDMPGMNGVQLCKKIREQRAKEELAIIGISSHNNEFLAVQFIKNGANDFIKKPFQREEFYLRVVQNQETIEHFKKLHELGELKNRFLGIAAHDLRNPINGIKGFSELLAEELRETGTASQVELAQLINMASGQMLQLVNDLLDISVIERGHVQLHPGPTDLCALIMERAKIMSITAASKEVAIETDIPKRCVTTCDGKRIAQVLDNLLGNALKFSPSNATVSISLRMNASTVTIGVRDQGPGVPPHFHQDLFKNFTSLQALPLDKKHGTGLGLSIVKKVIDMHQGHVWLDREYTGGAHFLFKLPYTPLDTPQPAS